jgi:hypothetical protein
MKTLRTVYEYMRAYSPLLSERILSTYRPLHSPADSVSPLLGLLKRTLLPAQKIVVMAVAKYLRKANAAKIVGECGTGKTFMSLAACYVHANGQQHTGLVMCAPHLVEKWAREIFNSIPHARVFLIHDMRNGGDPRKPHGVCEVQWKSDHLIRNGWAGRLTDLRGMGRKGWKKTCPEPAWFVLGRERGKLSYYWKHVFKLAKSGKLMGALVNPDSGDRVLNSEGESLYGSDFRDSKRSEVITRGAQGADGIVSGSQMFSALWSADRSKLQRMAPLDYIGRYLKGWWNYSIADEVHELNGDTAQGNGLAVLARAAEKTIAMTGTIMGGYADDIYRVLYRMDGPRMARDGLAWGTQGQRAFQETYGTIEEIRKVNPQDNRCSRAPKANVTVRRRPGASPLLFGKYLMDSTAFIFLEDIAETLPAYEEQVVGIRMDKKLSKAYEELEKQIKDALHEYPKSGSSITSLMLNTLLVYPDHPFGFGPLKALVRDGNGEVQRVQVAEPENLDEGILYPKEEWLIDDLRKERREGRRSLVFATYTGEHDVPFRLEQVLRREGFRVAVMRATVQTDRREAWIADRLREGVDVVLCHPRLVQTGLDLPAFPTIYFYETGYSLYTLRQASRRSWRIGQHRNVRVKFVHYLDTLQERCLRLMGKKLMVALAVEGKFTGEGLQDAGDEDAADILTALARELVSEGRIGETADAVWASLARERAKMAPDAHRVEMEVQPELDEPSILALPSPQSTETPQEPTFAFAGDVLLFPESFANARKQRGSKINPPPVFPHSEQLSLFADLAGVA